MRLLLVPLLPLAALTGCGGDGPSAAAPVPPATVTATVTETATATVTETATPLVIRQPAGRPSRKPAPLPKLHLEVFSDGCGVIRSDEPPATAYQNLTWVFRDQDGFQVLGRLAEGETHYRYFGAGTYDVVLEAFGGDHYVPVSNEVTVRC